VICDLEFKNLPFWVFYAKGVCIMHLGCRRGSWLIAWVSVGLACVACGSESNTGGSSGTASSTSGAMSSTSSGSSSGSAADAGTSSSSSGSSAEAGAGKAFGEVCAADDECVSKACFPGEQGAYCSLKCTAANAADICAKPLTSGVCNNRGYCKKP
jgi:hypothetical protein